MFAQRVGVGPDAHGLTKTDTPGEDLSCHFPEDVVVSSGRQVLKGFVHDLGLRMVTPPAQELLVAHF
ncbi:hypothetical protein BLA24_01515 [Streptomyces cinnamoneus]|nr:hypothetical protein BLA24_01515 [Streptomyces cinnamoneus]